MKIQRELFIGVTSWNSALFLPVCLEAIRRQTRLSDLRLCVLDNASQDQSVEIARRYGAEIIVERCSQADALNRLFFLSDARYTLLLHADVVLLSPHWFERCVAPLQDETFALVSPEDIGCGPYSRPFGMGKPESSFMLFATARARRAVYRQWRRWHRLPYPHSVFDFYGEHITHRIPQRFEALGLRWQPMRVHISDQMSCPIYTPTFRPAVWSELLPYLRYGLGNFYSLDGEITHYHNWYERVDMKVEMDSTRSSSPDGRGFPLAYIRAYTEAFLRDHLSGQLVLPATEPYAPEPRAL